MVVTMQMTTILIIMIIQLSVVMSFNLSLPLGQPLETFRCQSMTTGLLDTTLEISLWPSSTFTSPGRFMSFRYLLCPFSRWTCWFRSSPSHSLISSKTAYWLRCRGVSFWILIRLLSSMEVPWVNPWTQSFSAPRLKARVMELTMKGTQRVWKSNSWKKLTSLNRKSRRWGRRIKSSDLRYLMPWRESQVSET